MARGAPLMPGRGGPVGGHGLLGSLKRTVSRMQPVEVALALVLLLGLTSICRGLLQAFSTPTASRYAHARGTGDVFELDSNTASGLNGGGVGDDLSDSDQLPFASRGDEESAGAGGDVGKDREAELRRARRFDPGLIASAGDPLPQEGWEAALRDDEMREDPPKRPFYWWFRYRTAQGGFPSSGEEGHTGPADGRHAVSDGSCGGSAAGVKKGAQPQVSGFVECSGHGFCRRGKCYCVKGYEGIYCEKGAKLPGLPSPYTGSFVLSRESLLRTGGIRFRTDPSEEPPPTKPYVRLPVSKEVWVAQPKHDIFQNKIYETCAVVGASGVLRFYTYGKEIDNHDAIFRFNRAPTRRFEKFVGTRTTYRFESPLHAGFHEGNESNIMPMPTKSYLYLHTVYHRKHPYTKLYLLDVGINAYAATAVQALPSVGYLALVTALHRCASVTVYGFSWQSAFGVPHHYWDNQTPRRGQKSAYDYEAEQAHVRKLAKAGHVTLPEPCIAGCEKISGTPCTNCPPGSTCTCESRYPMPVALPGFCRIKGQYACFYRCPGGVLQCPGGIRHTRCPKAMTPHIIKSLGLECTTPEDLRKNPAPALPGADVITEVETNVPDASAPEDEASAVDDAAKSDASSPAGTDGVVESEFPR